METLVQTRRNIWAALLQRKGIPAGSAEEAGLIQKLFGGLASTFQSDLSRGFSPRHAEALSKLCESVGIAYDPSLWLRPAKRAGFNAAPHIGWGGEPIHSTGDFYSQLEALYLSASSYTCLRVGGLYSRNRTRFEAFDGHGLPIQPSGPTVRTPYLEGFWRRVIAGSLTGTSVHVIKTIDRLVELWSSVELLRRHSLLDTNRVFLAPVSPRNEPDFPLIGVRIVDDTRTLFSLPPPPEGRSTYSWWIEADNVALFAAEYVSRVIPLSQDMGLILPVNARRVFELAFKELLPTANLHSGNYGYLDTFEKVEVVKERMIEWAEGGLWFPVIA